jgi:phosphatidylglycerol:prolipoprotein diacylglycerol transferase
MNAAIPFPNISPELFSFSIGGFELAIRWYALSYVAGILIGWLMAIWALKRWNLWHDDRPPMAREQFGDLVTWLVFGIILGGRLGYVLFYQFDFFLENPAAILRVWEGGMSFHGGFLGVVVAGLLFCWKNKIPILPTADLLAFATPPGLMLGRIANFINAELWGRPTDVPWGVVFPGQAAQDCPSVVGDCARHPSQLYEAGLEGLALGLIIYILVRFGIFKLRGFATGMLLLGYGSARAFVELYRQADPQFITPENPFGYVIQFGEYGLSMGQILSTPMIGLGLLFILMSVVRR